MRILKINNKKANRLGEQLQKLREQIKPILLSIDKTLEKIDSGTATEKDLSFYRKQVSELKPFADRAEKMKQDVEAIIKDEIKSEIHSGEKAQKAKWDGVWFVELLKSNK